MSKHTPGPWAVKELKDRYRQRWIIQSTDGSPIGEAYEMRASGMKNAPLIAAAPELLELMQYALALSEENLMPGVRWQQEARAAIAKAKGESNEL